jgi:UDP-N-acetylglucosamine 4-epimerase
MKNLQEQFSVLAAAPRAWLVTGVAGFIGSNLLETLLLLGQRVVGLDNFATGHRHNLEQVAAGVGPEAWARFAFIEGDIRSLENCRQACQGVDIVLHQAALGSVPRSIDDPLSTHATNCSGFLNMLVAARDAGVERFVYAASSAAYGDHPALPKVEHTLGKPLSPYGLSKYVNELYAGVFAGCYGFQTIGLRYFNVFGARQDPNSQYSAVIPCWIAAMLRNQPAYINGDGGHARDFCYIENAVQANLLAATTRAPGALDQVYNVAVGEKTSLSELFELIRAYLAQRFPHVRGVRPVHREERKGDVRYSLADISKAERLLGYRPRVRVPQGLEMTIDWYIEHLSPAKRAVLETIGA